MKNFWNFFLNNRQFSYVVLITLILFGFQSLLTIPRESSPEVQVPVAIVTTVFPGASTVDVERLLTDKIEERLENNLENVNNITSTSREGISTVVVEFDASADIDSSIRDAKDEVDLVKPDLPTEANDPIVSEVNFVDEPVLTISLQSSLSERELILLVEDVEKELEKIKGVSRIDSAGLPKREVQVVVRKESLSQYNLSILDITRALQISNSSLPVGSIETGGVSYAVTFKGDITDPEQIKNVSISRPNGGVVYIRDIADVTNGVTNKSTISRISLGGNPSESSVSLSVFKQGGGDVTRLSDDIREKLSEMREGILSDTPYLVSFDSGEFVKEDLKSLSFSAFQTVVLVMIILFLSLGWREAILAGISIPLSFLVAFIGLKLSGNTINFISLFSLILSVGILVDSAIVVTEAVHTKMKEMKDKTQAARETIDEFYYPLMSGTMTTIAVFAPLFLLSGVTGQFIAGIPFTIIFVLLASLFIALGVVPLIGSVFLKRRARSRMEEKQEEITHVLQEKYRNFLKGIIGNRKKEKRFMQLIVLMLILSLALPFIGLVKVEFFSQEDVDFLFVEVEKPEGTTLEITDLSVREVEEVLYSNPDIESFVSEVGRGSAFAGSGGSGEKIGNVTIILKKDREADSTKILRDLRSELSKINSADVRISQASNGPPTGAPVSIRFFGDDIDTLSAAVLKGENLLESIEGTTEVTSSAQSDATEFELVIDRAKASQFGLDASTVALTLRTAIYGTTATSINNIDGDIDVIVKMNLNENGNDPHQTTQTTLDSIKKISIPTPRGSVLIGSLVSSEIDSASAVINHEDRKRIATISSQLSGDITSREIIAEFMNRVDELDLPDDIEVAVGAGTEDANQSFKEMGYALFFGIVLIMAILILQFKSYRQSFMIIAIVPFTLIGVFVGLALSGKSLSFPSMMGFIALSGIVVNNSIILIDSMNGIRRNYPHNPIDEVVINASVSRLRPILLTTLTTVIGIIPLTYSSDLWSPLAFAIMFGLSFAVVVTLILVPILYARWPGKMTE